MSDIGGAAYNIDSGRGEDGRQIGQGKDSDERARL